MTLNICCYNIACLSFQPWASRNAGALLFLGPIATQLCVIAPQPTRIPITPQLQVDSTRQDDNDAVQEGCPPYLCRSFGRSNLLYCIFTSRSAVYLSLCLLLTSGNHHVVFCVATICLRVFACQCNPGWFVEDLRGHS